MLIPTDQQFGKYILHTEKDIKERSYEIKLINKSIFMTYADKNPYAAHSLGQTFLF